MSSCHGVVVRIDAKPAKLAVRPVVALKRSIAVAHDLPEEQYRTGAECAVFQSFWPDHRPQYSGVPAKRIRTVGCLRVFLSESSFSTGLSVGFSKVIVFWFHS